MFLSEPSSRSGAGSNLDRTLHCSRQFLPQAGRVEERKQLLEKPQRPDVIMVTCSDSRLSPEGILHCKIDQGSVFVVRTAGHVLGPTDLESIAYAVDELEVPVLTVVGHSGCGAVTAALKALGGSSKRGAKTETKYPHLVGGVARSLKLMNVATRKSGPLPSLPSLPSLPMAVMAHSVAVARDLSERFPRLEVAPLYHDMQSARTFELDLFSKGV